MAFDLKRVLKVMLFASDGALSVKDIQTAVTRFHEQATALPLEDGAPEGTPDAPAEERIRHPHRLELPPPRIQDLERAAAGDLLAHPDRPEGHAGLTEPVHVEGMHALRR